MTSSRTILSVPSNESFSPDARDCFDKQTNLIIGVAGIIRCILQSDADVSDIKTALQLAADILGKRQTFLCGTRVVLANPRSSSENRFGTRRSDQSR